MQVLARERVVRGADRAPGGERVGVFKLRIVSAILISLALPVVAGAVSPKGMGTSCVGLSPPVQGIITAPFAPGPNWSGHWGVDFVAVVDGPVRASASGIVTHSGPVVENLTVTLNHGGGLSTSYSYLDSVMVKIGQRVSRGEGIGVAGTETGHGVVHFSVRRNGEYVDPAPLVGCLQARPSDGLRLVSVR